MRMNQRHGWMAAAAVTLFAWTTPASASDPAPWASESDWDIPNEYVVDFEDDTAESVIEEALTALGVTFRETDLEDDTRVEIVTLTAQTAAALAQLQSDPRVEHVEPHARVRAMWVPDDPMYEKQWH